MRLIVNDLINKSKSIKLFVFTIFSGLGFAIDFGIFSFLIYLDTPIFISNITAGFFAVSFVYFTSAKHVFNYRNNFLLIKFIAYIIFNAFRIYFLSLLIVFYGFFRASSYISKGFSFTSFSIYEFHFHELFDDK